MYMEQEAGQSNSTLREQLSPIRDAMDIKNILRLEISIRHRACNSKSALKQDGLDDEKSKHFDKSHFEHKIEASEFLSQKVQELVECFINQALLYLID